MESEEDEKGVTVTRAYLCSHRAWCINITPSESCPIQADLARTTDDNVDLFLYTMMCSCWLDTSLSLSSRIKATALAIDGQSTRPCPDLHPGSVAAERLDVRTQIHR
jgi:hypothetical protein